MLSQPSCDQVILVTVIDAKLRSNFVLLIKMRLFIKFSIIGGFLEQCRKQLRKQIKTLRDLNSSIQNINLVVITENFSKLERYEIL